MNVGKTIIIDTIKLPSPVFDMLHPKSLCIKEDTTTFCDNKYLCTGKKRRRNMTVKYITFSLIYLYIYILINHNITINMYDIHIKLVDLLHTL